MASGDGNDIDVTTKEGRDEVWARDINSELRPR